MGTDALTVVLTRDRGCWVADVPAIPGCHAFGVGLPRTLRRTRDAIGLFRPDVPTITPRFDLDPELARLIDEAASARAAAEAASLALRRAANALVDAGLSQRDAAMLLGVSRPRVQQLTSIP